MVSVEHQEAFRRGLALASVRRRFPVTNFTREPSGGFVQQNDWIYDCESRLPPLILQGRRVLLNDETLRDGLQNPPFTIPASTKKFASFI